MKVISLIGGDSQVGTSMIAQSLTESLTRYGKSTVLIFASGNYGEDYLRQGKYSIDSLYKREEGRFEYKQVKNVIENNGEIEYISGIKKIEDLPFYPIDFIREISNEMSDEFEYMIVDGGSNINSPLTVSSLVYADSRYIVLTQQEKSIKRYRNTKNILLEPKNLKGKIILNKYKEDEGLYTKEHLEFLLSEFVEVGFSYREEGWEKENEKETLMNNEIFAQEMCALRDLLIKETENKSSNLKEGSFFNEKTGEYKRSKRRVFFR